jgi:hypothetical protein
MKIPACVLSVDDLRRLFVDLDTYTREVTGGQIDGLPQSVGTAPADFVRMKQEAKAEAGLVMYVYGKNGEQLALHTAGAITREVLPDTLLSITFDSAARYRIKLGNDPLNRFTLFLDFSDPPGFVVYNPWDQPTPNNSRFDIIGTDQTWVAGVSDKVLNFLKARKRSRLWLHGPVAFNLIHWFIAFPAAFWLIYRLDSVTERLISGLPAILRSAFYIYLFLVLLLVMRVLIYLLRSLFPIVELEGSRNKTVRATIGVVELGLVSALIYDILKAAMK